MTQPHLHLAVPAHDRTAARRTDQAWLEARWADPRTRVLVVAGSRIRTVGDRVPWVEPSVAEQAGDGLRVLLGERDGRTWFALVIDPATAPGDRTEWLGLRALLPQLASVDVEDAPLVLHALGLAEWLLVTCFCPRCGGRLVPGAAGHQLDCPDCGRSQFPRTDPAVIMAIAHGDPGSPDEQILLGHQAVWPVGRFSTLAGFLEPGESLEDAVRREVLEEVGVPVGEVTYQGNQAWPLPASLMLGFTGRALSTEIVVDQHEIEEARWFTRAELLAHAESGEVALPAPISISRSLIETWYGGPLPGRW
ncbi:MAG: NAD(+) diphosphatase [Nocardioides sp.]|uniref:NAD(+) diphosphatase n=1 Tax=Nocardioides sp. TaxID=35761 RepID=UPI0039E42007